MSLLRLSSSTVTYHCILYHLSGSNLNEKSCPKVWPFNCQSNDSITSFLITFSDRNRFQWCKACVVSCITIIEVLIYRYHWVDASAKAWSVYWLLGRIITSSSVINSSAMGWEKGNSSFSTEHDSRKTCRSEEVLFRSIDMRQLIARSEQRINRYIQSSFQKIRDAISLSAKFGDPKRIQSRWASLIPPITQQILLKMFAQSKSSIRFYYLSFGLSMQG